MKFDELKFKDHTGGMGGVQAKIMFKNGFGASVIKTPFSYGGPDGLYEVAVLGENGRITYDTPITDDVEGRLSPKNVETILGEIEALASPS